MRAKANGVELEYEVRGPADGAPLLLVMGLGEQLATWPNGFLDALVVRGFRAIVFDNRDAGRSTWFDDASAPDLSAALGGDYSSAVYSLADLADDAAALLDALGIAAAHVAGISMGGMVAQLVALRHPAKVLSLASLASHPGDGVNGRSSREAIAAILTPQPADRAEYVENALSMWRTLGSPGYSFDEPGVRALAARLYDRGYHPLGVLRQFLAILAAPDRTAALAAVRAPTLVVHGDADVLVDKSGGEATARAIPGAQLVRIPGLGHDLPAPVWGPIADAIASNAERAKP